MGGDWLFSIKSRHSIVKGFIVRAPRHLQTLSVDMWLDRARFGVRLTKACLTGKADPTGIQPGGVEETGLGMACKYQYQAEVSALLLPIPKQVTLTSNQQTGWRTSLVLSKEHSILISDV